MLCSILWMVFGMTESYNIGADLFISLVWFAAFGSLMEYVDCHHCTTSLSTSTTEARSAVTSVKNGESPKRLFASRGFFSLEMASSPTRNSSPLREGQPILTLVLWKVVLPQATFGKSLPISKQVSAFADDSEEHLIEEVGMRSSERARAAQEGPYGAHWAPHISQTSILATLNAWLCILSAAFDPSFSGAHLQNKLNQQRHDRLIYHNPWTISPRHSRSAWLSADLGSRDIHGQHQSVQFSSRVAVFSIW
jgi:hypothetical protein